MRKISIQTSAYDDLKNEYELSQSNLQQTKQLLNHLTSIQQENRLPNKQNYVDRMLHEQYAKYECETKHIHQLEKQLNLQEI